MNNITGEYLFEAEGNCSVETNNEAARLEGFEAQWADAGGGSDANRIAAAGTP